MSFMFFFLMKYFYMILNLTIIKKDNIMIKIILHRGFV